ncbi:uncharacterized protein J4E92_008714 [Alternaria infectoria]|uniref:uncharacterized protein n=1 Tax=Alternaria infectoria TaxID=45303 RepID=UPI00221ECDB0|nr:uncharacterized protein J4E92_008714 [Alternaria infectoria]KAI4919070.1 hypothetical protein J4E92_008714 [Alternaria infectoria]
MLTKVDVIYPKPDRTVLFSTAHRIYNKLSDTIHLYIIMSGATAIVLYPRKEGSTFNKEYYLKTHMPLAMKNWKDHGLKSYAVSELNADGPYAISTVMEFDSLESVGKALQSEGTKEVMEDVKNFSSETPILVHGNVVGRS